MRHRVRQVDHVMAVAGADEPRDAIARHQVEDRLAPVCEGVACHRMLASANREQLVT
jgi:hypothetical protein